MFIELRRLLELGYAVNFHPEADMTVTLTVQEAKNGTVKGVEVDLTMMEWAFAEQGITERLKEALTALEE